MEYCEYELHRNPSAAPTKDRYMHARLVTRNRSDLAKLAHELSQRVNQKESMLHGALKEFIRLVDERLGQGEHVQIDGLGGFQITLQCPAKVKNPEDVHGSSIKVKSVQYRPDVKLVKRLQAETKLRRSQAKRNQNNTMELVLEAVREYFGDPSNTGKGISSRHLADALHITRQSASDRLHELVSMKFLVNVSPDVRHPIYLVGPRYTQE